MKRILALFLLAATLFTSVACSGLTPDTLDFPEGYNSLEKEKEDSTADAVYDPTGFSVGYARVDITPTESTILGGFPNATQRYSKSIADRLYITCVAISDGEKTALFFSYDMLSVPNYIRTQLVKLIEKDLNIPRELVWLTATHTHHAPGVSASSTHTTIVRYLAQLYAAIRQCGKRAVETLDSAEMYVGRTETVGLNFVRRYVSVLDGSWVGGNDTPSNSDPAKVRHETIADPEMQIIKFDRKNAKDVVMVNWQSHYTGTGLENTQISASWVSTFREKTEKELGIDFAFYQGGAGNVVVGSELRGEPSSRSYDQQGYLLANTMIAAMPSLKKIPTGKIEGVSKMETVYYNRDTEGYNVDHAKEIVSVYATDTAAANELCKKYGFQNYHHAKGIVSRSKRTTDTTQIEICAIRVGSVGFASTPYEMFHENGTQVKDGSPFETTFMCAYTNGSHSYVPALHSFPNGGYEVNVCYFIPGTGEQVANSLIEMLKDLKK